MDPFSGHSLLLWSKAPQMWHPTEKKTGIIRAVLMGHQSTLLVGYTKLQRVYLKPYLSAFHFSPYKQLITNPAISKYVHCKIIAHTKILSSQSSHLWSIFKWPWLRFMTPHLIICNVIWFLLFTTVTNKVRSRSNQSHALNRALVVVL